MTRREAACLIGGTGASLLLPSAVSLAATENSSTILMRPIPSSGEKLPVIGLGTSQVFDVEPDRVSALEPVIISLVKLGGRVIDSSPMYGHAEEVIGDLLAQLKLRDSVFLATKVWTQGKQAGIESMKRSRRGSRRTGSI